MARNVSDEELQLKKRARRRLVGAIVLVTVVAVVLPMVLDSEPKTVNQNINIQIPSPDAGVLTTPPTPLKQAEPAATPARPESEPVAVAPAVAPKESKSEAVATKPEAKTEVKAETKPQEVKAETKVESTAEAKPEPITEAKTETKAPAKAVAKTESAKTKDSVKEPPKAATTGGFVIQVAALSDTAKAKELQAKIAGSGLKAYTEVVQTSKGPVTRVRVGPFNTREAAEKARPQLQKLQLDGKVVPR
jgi:DedD protein